MTYTYCALLLANRALLSLRRTGLDLYRRGPSFLCLYMIPRHLYLALCPVYTDGSLCSQPDKSHHIYPDR